MGQKSKPVWDTLASKADLVLRSAQIVLEAAKTRKYEAGQRQRKLDVLLSEYSCRLNNILSRPHNTKEAGSYRQFIVQLQSLKQRSDDEFKKFSLEYDNAQKKVIVADQEKLKLVRLGERVRITRQRERLAIETKEVEAQSLMQFYVKSRTTP